MAEPQALTVQFISRARHLDRLNQHLARALNGTGQVCFVTGEPGAGKTALVADFTRAAQQEHKNVIVAFGDCNALSAEGDPYLPFREMMVLLLGDVEHGVSEGNITLENASRLRRLFNFTRDALLEAGPDIVGIFVPGGSLLARLGTKLVQQNVAPAVTRTGVDQSQVLHQFTSVLRKLAAQNPLILVVDDLHWADQASISLLFHLARRIEGTPILIVGTYRPHEIDQPRASGSHPLGTVVNEIRRYYGDILIDLDSDEADEKRAFVERLLDAEPNDYPRAFREEFLQRTDAQPLFAVELLQAMKEQTVIARDRGLWHIDGVGDWRKLPGRVEGVIAERVRRLPPDLQSLLTDASVQGELFSVEILANLAGKPALDVLRSLGDAHQKHRVVRPCATRRDGGVRLSQFRFVHNLFQTYLYERMSEAERAYRHEAVGGAMEEVYSTASDLAAAQLAHHYAVAGNARKALHYLRAAGDAARRKYAHQEALGQYQRALAFARDLDDVAQLATLHEAVGDVQALTGFGAEAVVELQSALDLVSVPLAAARLHRKIASAHSNRHFFSDAESAFSVATATLESIDDRDRAWWQEWAELKLIAVWLCYFDRGNPRRLMRLIAEFDEHVDHVDSPVQVAGFKQVHVMAALREEKYRLTEPTLELARAYLETARASRDEYQNAMAIFQLGFCELWAGSFDAARQHLEEGLERSARIGAAFPAVLAVTYLAVEARMCGDVERVTRHTAAAAPWLREARNDNYTACAAANEAWLRYKRNQVDDAVPFLGQALEVWSRPTNSYPFAWLAACPLAAIHAGRGDMDAAVAMFQTMLGPVQQEFHPGLTSSLHQAIRTSEEGDVRNALALAAQFGLH
ncbi:MAG: AAA family ATPase [Gemmatimonadota bacterium]